MIRKLSCTLFFILILLLSIHFTSANVFANYSVSNNNIEYVLNEHGLYTIGTTGGQENYSADDYKRLIYGHPNPGTSYTTIKLDGAEHKFTSFQSPILNIGSLSSTAYQNINNVNFQQNIRIIRNSNTLKEDTVEIRYKVTNNDTQAHDTGLRIMMDTMLGNNDAAPFRIPGVGAVTTETEYTGENIPQYWQAFDNLASPTVTAQGSFYSSFMNKPDKVQFTNWGNVMSTPWNYIVRTGSSNGDSAVSVYWNPDLIQPGEVREYITYYGLTEFTQDLEPPLAVNISAPHTVELNNGTYSPDPYILTAYINNVGTASANNVKAKVIIPEGIKLKEGFSEEINLGAINVNELKQSSWQLQIEPSEENKTLEYSIVITSDDTEEKVVTRTLEIPSILNEITGLTVEPETLSLSRGDSAQLSVQGKLINESTKNITPTSEGTTYISNNGEISINQDGLLTVSDFAMSGTYYVRAYNNGHVGIVTVNIDAPMIEDIIVTPERTTLSRNDSLQLQISALMSDGETVPIELNGNVTFQNLDSTRISVSSNGAVLVKDTALGGEAKIRIVYAGIIKEYIIDIDAPTIDSITTNVQEITLEAGETFQIESLAHFSDGSEMDITEASSGIIYSSSNNRLATINSSGLITIPSTAENGVATIMVSYGGKTTSVQVNTDSLLPERIELEPVQLTLQPGQSYQFRVTAYMNDGSLQTLNNRDVDYTVSSSYAQINSDGYLTLSNLARDGVQFNVKASYGDYSSISIITVDDGLPDLANIEFVEDAFLMQPGDSKQLLLKATMSDGSVKEITSDANYTRSSSYANVSSAGLLQLSSSTKFGMTITVTATYEGKSTTATINVANAGPTVESINFEENTFTLAPGGSKQLKMLATMSDGTTQEITSGITYTRSSSYAAVSNSGVLQLSTSTRLGMTITVTATYEGKSTTATINVANAGPTVESINFEENTFTLAPGGSKQLKMLATMSDGTTQEITSGITYTRSSSYAAVSNSGVLQLSNSTRLGMTITVTAFYEGKSTTATINVANAGPTVESINFEENTFTLAPGGSKQLKMLATMSDGTTQEITSGITYTRSSSYAAVSNSGVLQLSNSTRLGMTITVTASYEGKSTTATINVANAGPTVESINFEENTFTLAPGGSKQLKMLATMSDGTTQEITSGITYTRSSSYATVSNSGVLQLSASTRGGMTITISAILNGKTAVTSVHVQ
ncbi:hypothetical protein [Fictibacillus phosphorivorans]|uniref:hypothetical protein n=1 Tax=Fictibacillus phosphorivorans TaxID=1221500 RepID=UPI0035E67E92